MKLSGITRPQKLNMEIRIEGSDAVNDWDFWVYPAQVELAQGNVYTTDTLDAKAISILQEGGNVLITAAGKIQYGKEVKQYFTPVFWNLPGSRCVRLTPQASSSMNIIRFSVNSRPNITATCNGGNC